MIKNIDKHKVKVLFTSLVLLMFGFLVFRFIFAFFNLHNMKQFPEGLFIFSIVLLMIAYFFDLCKLMLGISIGYNIGYLSGALFHTNWIDIHGTAMNNWWIWSLSVMFVIVCLSFFIDVKNRRNKNTGASSEC